MMSHPRIWHSFCSMSGDNQSVGAGPRAISVSTVWVIPGARRVTPGQVPFQRTRDVVMEYRVVPPKEGNASVAKAHPRQARPRVAPEALGVARKRELQELLGELAQVDLLTELPSRGQFLDRLTGAMARARRNTTLLGVMRLNVDHFKVVNRTHGHRVADLVLKEMAGRLKRSTRLSDTIGRLGGDECAVILEGLQERQGAAIAGNRALKVVSPEAFV